MQTLLKISPALLLAACAFDDSALASKTACRFDSDCTAGVCIDGTCDPAEDELDVGADALPDTSLPDTTECDTPNACGGCQPLTGSAGDPCDDECGALECSIDGEQLECNGVASNPCGGCAPLEAPPGLQCDDCGTWECEGTDAVVCVGAGTNECGGCGILEGRLGEPCGDCGGDLLCDGLDSLTCVGADTDACGGCDGPFDVSVGDACACTGSTAATWTCDGQALSCGDRTSALSSAVSLGPTSDNSAAVLSVRASLHTGNDADYYSIRVVDTDDLVDGLFPIVTIEDVPEDRRVCAFWLYDDRRVWSPRCASDAHHVIFEGNQACCSTGGPDSQIAIMRDIVAFERLDDLLAPGTASGVLYTAVETTSSDADPACAPYRLQFSF